jgi:arginine exporter protein ArgO
MNAMNAGSAGRAEPSRGDAHDDWVRKITLVIGIVFLLVGIAGFIPGVTTHYSDLKFAGHQSDAKLIGIFEVSVLHNIVHLLFGVVGLAAARTARSAATYLVGGGVVYAVVWIYGLLVGQESTANFIPLNTADNWLHFVLAVAMIVLGVVAMRAVRRTHGPATGATGYA